MGQLGEKDRAAVVLRFFGDKSFVEVAAASGVSENAAKNAVSHALEKLHRYFSKRGVKSATAVIAGAISAHSVQAAPAALATSVTLWRLPRAQRRSIQRWPRERTMKIMTWLKFKFAAGLGAAVLLAGSVATVAISQSTGNDKLTRSKSRKKQRMPTPRFPVTATVGLL